MTTSEPTSIAGKLSLSAKMIAGATLFGEAIHLTHFTAASLTAARSPVVSALNAFTAARNAQQEAYQSITDVVAPIDAFIAKLVDALKPKLGRRWSAAWSQVGFYKSLALPHSNSGRWNVLQATVPYLTAHPECENPVLGITHQIAAPMLAGISMAVNNLGACRADLRTKRDERDAAMVALVEEMRGMMKELSQVLAADDPRWRAFGLNIPADKQVPEAVTDLAVSAAGTGELFADWTESARAVRYLVEMLVVGVDVAFRRVATVYDPNTTLEDLTPGDAVKVRVIAANAGGLSAPSAEVQVTVPAMLARAA